MKDPRENSIRNKGFEFVKTYSHDYYVTNRYKKGCLEVEFTYLDNKLVTFDVTIDEAIGVFVTEKQLEQLDNILNIGL